MLRIILLIAAVICCSFVGSGGSPGKRRGANTLTGTFLYEASHSQELQEMQEILPSRIEVKKDDNGSEEITVLTSPEEIQEAVDAFLQIQIGEKTDIYMTDQYNSISFFFPDDAKVVLLLNGRNLEWKEDGKTELYELENADTFWKEVGLK